MKDEWGELDSDELVVEEEEIFGRAPTFEDMMAARKLTIQDIREHISGPVLSVVVHVVVLALLSTLVVFRPPEEGENIEVKQIVLEVKPFEKKLTPPEPEPDPTEPKTESDVDRPEMAESDTNLDTESFAVDTPNVDIVVPNLYSIKPTASALTIPALYGDRMGGAKGTALAEHGGGHNTENAILKGLRWLKSHQNDDGSWGEAKPGDHPALTGMALLAYLGYGVTPKSEEFGTTIMKATKKLVEFLGPDTNGVMGGYRHGIVMYALCEAYAITRIPMLEGVVNKGMVKLIRGMNPAGAFNYGYGVEGMGPGHGGQGRSDLSVSGWNYQALKAAITAACSAEGLEAALDKGITVGLRQTFYDKGAGAFCYATEDGARKGVKGTMTAAGVLCLQLMGAGDCPQAKAGVKYLERANQFTFDFRDPTDKQWSFYQWYYETQAIFQAHKGEGRIWKKWNNMFSKELVRRQKTDGRWESPGDAEQKHLKGLNLPIYSTSLGCLMLEVYYRYLPTYHLTKVEHAGRGGNGELDLGL